MTVKARRTCVAIPNLEGDISKSVAHGCHKHGRFCRRGLPLRIGARERIEFINSRRFNFATSFKLALARHNTFEIVGGYLKEWKSLYTK